LWMVLFAESSVSASVEVFARNTVDIVCEGYGRKHGWDISRVFLGALTGFVL
jgi:hypothetical protein